MVLLGATSVLYLFISTPHLPLLAPDTMSYLEGRWYRAPGYPAYLHIIWTSFGNLNFATLLQLVIGVATLGAYLVGLGKLFRAPLVALAVALYFIPHAHHLLSHLYLLTESPFITLMLAHFTLTGLFLGSARFRTVPVCIGISLFAAAACTVRVPGIVLLANLLFLMIRTLNSRHRLALTIPFLCVLGAWSGWNAYTLGTVSPFVRGGLHQLANVVHLVEADMPGKHPELYAFIGARNGSFKPRIAAALSFREQNNVAYRITQDMQARRREMAGWRGVLRKYVQNHLEEVCPGKSLRDKRYHPAVCGDALEKQIAEEVIRHDPAGFALRVARNFRNYWSRVHLVKRFRGQEFIGRYAECASNPGCYEKTKDFGLDYAVGDKYDYMRTVRIPWLNLGPTLSRVELGKVLNLGISARLSTIVSALELLAGVVIAWVFLIRTRLQPSSLRQLSPEFSMVFLLAMTINAVFLSSSLAHTGVTRYSANLEVLAMTSLVFSLLLVSRRLKLSR